MWISNKKWEAMEKRITDLENNIRDQQTHIMNNLILNNIRKETMNYELLKYLFEKLGLEESDLKNNLSPGDQSTNSDGQRNK